MVFRIAAAVAAMTVSATAADLTAVEIMARVATNQDRAVALRRTFVYQQQMVVATRHVNGKLAREEKADYAVTPGSKEAEKKLVSITGKYQRKGEYVDFKGQPVPDSGTLDGSLIQSFRDDLLNEKTKDGIGKDLFPLTTEEQKNYRFELKGRKHVQGRDTYIIAFSPADEDDLAWAGEAWIDADEFQPVRVFTHLSKRMPFFVRNMMGTDLPGFGFNVQYVRVDKDVWFPASFGSEFRLRAVFFIKRDISMSMQASGFKQTKVDSQLKYEIP